MRAPLTLFVLVLLASCTTYALQPLDAKSVLAELRADVVKLPADGLTPTEAVAVALVHNPDLRARRRRHDIAAAVVVSRSAWENPELRVSLDQLYSRINAPLRYALDLRFFPPIPGEMAAERERLRAREQRVLARIEEREIRVASQTRLAHARVVLLMGELDILHAAQALHARLEELVRRGVAAGVTTRAEETLVILRREQIGDELREVAAQRALAEADLAALLGAPPGARSVVARRRTREAVAESPVVDWAAEATRRECEALHKRPELRELVARHTEREQRLRLSHLAKIPWPRHVQAGYSGLPTDTGFDVDLALELPVFDAGDSAVAIAAAQRDLAVDEYRAQLHAVRGEIHRALLDLREQLRRRDLLEHQREPLLRQAAEIVSASMQTGAANARVLIDLESRVLDARRDGVRAAYDLDRARIAVAVATGALLTLR